VHEQEEWAELREFRAEVPTADTARLAAGRWRLTSAVAAEQESDAVRSRRFRALFVSPARPRWRLARRTALIAVTAAAVTAGVLVAVPDRSGAGGPSQAGPAGAGPAVPSAAGPTPVPYKSLSAALAAAATKIETTSVTLPGPDQWTLADQVGCMNGKCTPEPLWVRGDGKKWAGVRLPVPARGVPHIDINNTFQNPSNEWMRFDPLGTYKALAALPTEPHALLKKLSSDPHLIQIIYSAEPKKQPDPSATSLLQRLDKVGGADPTNPPVPSGKTLLTPGEQFWNIVQILQDASVISPQVNAALYRALALIPGAELLPQTMADGYGRPSLTFRIDRTYTLYGPENQVQVNHFTDYLFLNPTTYAYQGSLDVSHSDGQDAPWEYARKSPASVVSAAGQLPGGSAWKGYPMPKPPARP
jgi:hypothetical protein